MASSEEPYPVEFRLLGPFEVAVGRGVVEIGSPKQRPSWPCWSSS